MRSGWEKKKKNYPPKPYTNFSEIRRNEANKSSKKRKKITPPNPTLTFLRSAQRLEIRPKDLRSGFETGGGQTRDPLRPWFSTVVAGILFQSFLLIKFGKVMLQTTSSPESRSRSQESHETRNQTWWQEIRNLRSPKALVFDCCGWYTFSVIFTN